MIALVKPMMNQQIRIRKHTTLGEVLAWDFSRCESVALAADAGFELGAEGVAIARLRQSAHRPRLRLVCEFPEPTSAPSFLSSPLGSPFGIAVVRVAGVPRFERAAPPGAASWELTLLNLLRERDCCLLSDTRFSVVALDPRFPLPLAKRALDSPLLGFPPPSAFVEILHGAMTSLKVRPSYLYTFAEDLAVFLHELFKNTYEHAVPHYSTFRTSTRALIVERIPSETLHAMVLSSQIRKFLERALPDSGQTTKSAVLALTVADQGDGIQSTLPARSAESTVDTVLRAFQKGQSKKPPGEIDRGVGLPKVLGIAFDLSAMLRVYSSGVVATADFTLEENKYPAAEAFAVESHDAPPPHGTSFTLLIPEVDSPPSGSDLLTRRNLRREKRPAI